MSTAGASLYQDLLLAHARAPRHCGPAAPGARTLHGVNSLCGDEVWVHVGGGGDAAGSGDRTREMPLVVTFEARGCAICRASASIMADAVAGGSAEAARALGAAVIAAFAAAAVDPAPAVSGDVRALLDLRAYPSRSRCVTLAWETLLSGLGGAARR
jgi:nitrogen fixation NifU-like protein